MNSFKWFVVGIGGIGLVALLSIAWRLGTAVSLEYTYVLFVGWAILFLVFNFGIQAGISHLIKIADRRELERNRKRLVRHIG